MKAFALFLTMIVVSSTGTALGAEYYQPAYSQSANAWQPQFQAPAGYAPQPPVVYYAPPPPPPPPVVYYAPPPVAYYAPPPVAYGGYGYDPFWGGVNVMLNFSDRSGHDHYDNGGYGRGGYGGNYGYGGSGRNYGHGSSDGNYGRGGGHGGSGLEGIVNGVLSGGYGQGGNYGRGGGHGGGKGHGGNYGRGGGHGGGKGHGGNYGRGGGKGPDYSRIASTVFGRQGNVGNLFRARH